MNYAGILQPTTCCAVPNIVADGHAMHCRTCYATVLVWTVTPPIVGDPRRHTLEAVDA